MALGRYIIIRRPRPYAHTSLAPQSFLLKGIVSRLLTVIITSFPLLTLLKLLLPVVKLSARLTLSASSSTPSHLPPFFLDLNRRPLDCFFSLHSPPPPPQSIKPRSLARSRSPDNDRRWRSCSLWRCSQREPGNGVGGGSGAVQHAQKPKGGS